MADPEADAARSERLTQLAVQSMRKSLNINARQTGKCTWTLTDGTLVLDSLISTILFDEASSRGSTMDELFALRPAILASALAALGDVEWISPTGFRLITGDIPTLELERRATELVSATEAKANQAEGNAKMEILTILSKAREYLAAVRDSATRSAKYASRLQQRMVDYNTKRQTKAEVQSKLADLNNNKAGNTQFGAQKAVLKASLDMAEAEQKAAFDLLQAASSRMDSTKPTASGATQFAGHTFNGIATQYNAVEHLAQPASPTKRVSWGREPNPERGSPMSATSATVVATITARIKKTFSDLLGYKHIEWGHDSTEFDKGLWLLGASGVWGHVKKFNGADELTRGQLLATTVMDSELPVPEMLELFFSEISKPRLQSSIQDELTKATNADMTCELKLRRIAGLLFLDTKLAQREPVIAWSGNPTDELAWDSMQRLINGMDESNPQKVKLLEMSASTKSQGLTMAEVRNLCRTVDVSTSISAKRKSIGEDDNLDAKRFLNSLQSQAGVCESPALDPKNGSCTFCGNSGHTRQVCRKLMASQNPSLVMTQNLGSWNIERITALEEQLKEAQAQHEALRVRTLAQPLSLAGQQASSGGQGPTQQQPTGQGGDAGYGGTSHSGHSKGKGKGSPYQRRSKGKGKASSWQTSHCARCQAPDHLVGACPKPDHRTCHNCGGVGHISWYCTAPPMQ